jgi:putative chitinase
MFFSQIAEESAGFDTTVEFGSGEEYNGRADLCNTHPGDFIAIRSHGVV